MKKIFSFCKSYLLACKWQVLAYVILSVIAGSSVIISPYIVGDFIDQVTVAEDISFIPRYFALYVGVNITVLAIGYISSRLYVRLQANLVYKLNRDFIMRFQLLPISYTQQQDSTYLNQRINQDANTLITFCISIVSTILINLIIIVVPTILLFTFNPLLAGVLLVVAILYLVLYRMYKHILYRVNYALQESYSKFFARLNEQMAKIRFIKLHGLFDNFILRLNSSFSAVLDSALRHQRANYIFSGLDKTVMILAQMVLLLLGGMAIISGSLTIGRFVLTSVYFGMILGSLRYFFNLGQILQSNMVAYNRLQELAQISTEPNGTQIPEQINSVELSRVSFSYGSESVINNMSFSMNKGKIYAILGSNGAGKSTLADVILGLQVGNFEGRVLYNGISMNELDMYSLRNRLIGVSEQEPTLLPDTLNCNLDLGNEGNAQSQKDKADFIAEMLGLKSYINSLPDQYNTVVNENAANLSGGEKQKISIMRALLKNPDVLVLDEPTSALDAASREALKQYLQELKKDKIIIVITHDREFINADDAVIKM